MKLLETDLEFNVFIAGNFSYFCLHTCEAVDFLHLGLANSWPGFQNLIREATSGHHSACAVQEALFATITDQRADKMSRIIIMLKFNKVKNSLSDSLCFQEFLILGLLMH